MATTDDQPARVDDAPVASDDGDLDDLPMKHLFVLELDTLLGRRIVEKFGKTGEYRIAGTLRADAVRQGLNADEAQDLTSRPLPPWVSEIVPSYLNDNVTFKQRLLAADVIICPMRDTTVEAAAAVRMLKNEQFETEKTLVVISSVLTWADTLKAQKAEELAARAAERAAAIAAGEEVDEEDAAAGGAGGDDAEEEEVAPLTEDQYQKRVPHPRYQAFKEVEQAAKAANSETLHTYVLFGGLTYGAGEDMLESFFKRAWHQQPLPLHTDGSNVVPMIHVDDLATAAFKAGTYLDVLPQRYILAVDRGNHKWSQVIDSLNKSMGNGESFVEPRLGSLPFAEYVTVDLRMEGATIADLIEDSEWAAPEGFVAAVDKVCAEYREAHGLTPLRCAVVGPPLVGKTTIAKRLASEYRVNRITATDVISGYVEYRDNLKAKITAHRRARALALRKAAKDEAKRLEREAEEERRRAAEEDAAGDDDAARGDDEDGDDAKDDDDAHAADGTAKTPEVVDDFEVSFEVDAPPPREAGDGDGDGGDADGDAGNADDEDGSPRGEDEDPGDQIPQLPLNDDDEEDEVLNKLKDDLALAEKVLSLKGADGRYVDEAMAAMGRRAITTAPSRNQGFVLDGFPATVRQAAHLFMVGEIPLPDVDEETNVVQPPEDVDVASYLAGADGALLLEHVIVCTATEACLVARSSACDAQDMHSGLTGFYRRLAKYKANNTTVPKPTHSVEAWFGAIMTNDEGHPRVASLLPVDLTSAAAPVGVQSNPADDGDAATATSSSNAATDVVELRLADCRTFLGAPRFVRPTPEDIVKQREDAVLAAEAARLDALRAEEAAAAVDAAHAAEVDRQRRIDERRLRSVGEERAAAAAIAAMPMNEYLQRFVVAAVADATTHVAQHRPEDPVNELADFLFAYQPRDKLSAVRGGGAAPL